jgi:4-diphosphocytidyl-2-C-methyl-D-erythritol kinase
MPVLSCLAPAKINLFLAITGRLPNGYHTLDTIFQTISLADELKLQWRSTPGLKTKFGLKLHRPNPACPLGPDNIILKAAQRLSEHMGFTGEFNFTLKKNIPIQAGLGGGSSDAAGAIRLLTKIYSPSPSPSQKRKVFSMAAKLGADVPFFLQGGLARAKGIGDKLKTLKPAAPFWAVVVKPPMGLSTPEVYGWYDAQKQSPIQRRNERVKLLTPQAKLVKLTSYLAKGAAVETWV